MMTPIYDELVTAHGFDPVEDSRLAKLAEQAQKKVPKDTRRRRASKARTAMSLLVDSRDESLAAEEGFNLPDGQIWITPKTEAGQKLGRVLVDAAAVHDATCNCDPKYRMSCPRMAQAILDHGSTTDEVALAEPSA